MEAGMITSPFGSFKFLAFTLDLKVLTLKDIGGEGLRPCGLHGVVFNLNPKSRGSSLLPGILKIFLLLTTILLSLALGDRLPTLLQL